ncbi:MAG: hypothetical protein OHK0023_02600 [Anaerolineae bacterium]
MQGWIITAAALATMIAWAVAFIPRAPILLWLTALALSSGALSLSMFWLALLGVPIRWEPALLICFLVGLIGLGIWRRSRLSDVTSPSARSSFPIIPIIVIGITCAAILFNAAYWMYSIDDAIAIYAGFGKQIYATTALPPLTPDSLYEGYPMLTPLLYAFAHSASGGINDSLAAWLNALLSIGVIGAAYALGRELYTPRVGGYAALLIAIMPYFTHWAGAGYTDLPAGFFYGLCAVFAARAFKGTAGSDVILCGIMAGLAAWAKNSGLIVVGSLCVWYAHRLWHEWGNQRRVLLELAVIGAVFFAVGGVWYVRNILEAGFILPPTGWTWAAERTIASLVPYLTDIRYSISGVFLTVGMFLNGAQAVISRGKNHELTLPIAFFAPFFVVWWALFSYDDRFLFAVLPIAAVMGAYWLDRLLARLFPQPNRLLQRVGDAIWLVLAVPSLWNAVDYKHELLRHPLMTLEERYQVTFGPRYAIGRYLAAQAGQSRVWTTDLRLSYHADKVQVISGGLPSREQAQQGDYIILAPQESLDWLVGTPIFEQDGWRVYRVA